MFLLFIGNGQSLVESACLAYNRYSLPLAIFLGFRDRFCLSVEARLPILFILLTFRSFYTGLPVSMLFALFHLIN